MLKEVFIHFSMRMCGDDELIQLKLFKQFQSQKIDQGLPPWHKFFSNSVRERYDFS